MLTIFERSLIDAIFVGAKLSCATPEATLWRNRAEGAAKIVERLNGRECHWKKEDWDDLGTLWHGDCGYEGWTTSNLAEDDVIYCPKCGGRIVEDVDRTDEGTT